MNEEKLISVGEASTILQVSERQVRRYCAEEKLQCRKDGKAFEIELGSVLALLKKDPNTQQETDVNDKDLDIDTDTVIEEQEHVRMPKGNVRFEQNEISTETIQILSENLQTVLKDVNEGTEILLKYLDFEHNKNLKLQRRLSELFDDVNTLPKTSKLKHSRRWIPYVIAIVLLLASIGILGWMMDYRLVIF